MSDHTALAAQLEAQQLHLIVERLPDRAIIALDEAGLITSWNRGAEQLYGYREHEIAGRHYSVLHSPDAGTPLRCIGRERVEEQWLSVRSDGRSFWARVTIAPLYDAGVVVGFAHLTHDLTEERRRTQQDAEHAITRVLAEPLNAAETICRLLQVVCDTLGWDMGTFWRVDATAGVLRADEEWHTATVGAEYARAMTHDIVFEPGEGLPGRVWSSGVPAWIADVLVDRNFPRKRVAREANVHGAFAAPVRMGEEVLGVMEFFSRQVREPDDAILATMEAAGINIGQLIRREQAEQLTRESEARFRALAENATIAIVIIDEDSVIDFANGATTRIFGHALEDLVGRPLTMLMPESHRERHHAGMLRYLRTGERRIPWEGMELPGLKADGTRVPLEISFGEFTREGRHYFTGIMRDISERKQAVEALRREAQQRAAVIATQEEIARTKLELNAVMQVVAERAAALTGATGATVELLEDQELVYRAVTGDAAPFAGLRLDVHASLSGLAVRSGRALKSDDARQDDRVDAVAAARVGARSMIIVPLFHRGEAVGALKVYAPVPNAFRERDVETLQLMGGLIGAAMARASEAERRTRLIRGFSHDVKNPLGAADGFLSLIEAEIMGELNEKQKSAVARARRAIGSATRLIEDLLDLSRAESGDIELDIAPLELRRFVHDLAEEYRAQAEATGVTIQQELNETSVIRTDCMRVRQIVANLLSNALKYGDRGRVIVRVGTRQHPTLLKPLAVVDVEDAGPGIPVEQQHLLFQEFKRLDPAKAPGAGLGLAISKRIAETLGGDLTVRSAAGQGSSFTLWLPLDAA